MSGETNGLEALARAYDREDASQRGEPSPWDDGADDATWRAERLACAKAGRDAYLAATAREEGGVEDALTGNAGLLGARAMASESLKSVASVRIAGKPFASQEAEVVAWVFELANARNIETNEPCHWGKPQLSFTRPSAGKYQRNVRALVAATPQPSPDADGDAA